MLQDTIQLALQNSANQNHPFNEQPAPPPPSSTVPQPTSINSDNNAVAEWKSFFQEQTNNLKAVHHQEVATLRDQLNQVKEKTVGKPNGGRNRFKKKRYDKDTQKEDDTSQLYREGPRVRKVINKYYWTHGASNHNGAECQYPDKHHKKEVTFADKMGGSTAFCQFVKNEWRYGSVQATDENEDQSWIKIKHGMKICNNKASHSSSAGNPLKDQQM